MKINEARKSVVSFWDGDKEQAFMKLSGGQEILGI